MNTADLVQAVRNVAATLPDFKFSDDAGCMYFEDYYDYNDECLRPTSEPCCIIGHGFSRLGFTSEVFETENTTRVRTVINLLVERGEVTATKDDVKWLSFVQHRQDRGCSWSHAVAEADKSLDDFRD